MDKLVSFKTAELAKKKNFPQNTRYKFLRGVSVLDGINNPVFGEPLSDIVGQPTQAHLQAWLREQHNAQVWVKSYIKRDGKWADYVVCVNNVDINDARDEEFQIYEEALEVGLCHALEML